MNREKKFSAGKKSKEYLARSLKITPGGVHSPVRAFKGVGGEAIFFQSAEGAKLRSCDGEEYIDFCMSFGPLILGHRDPDASAALAEMAETAWTFGAPEPYSLELAEWIVARIPWVEKLRFVCSGTEAVMSALRVARAATGRKKILKFSGCYHGHADALLVQAGSGLAGRTASSSAGVPADLVEHTLIAPLDNEAAYDEILKNFGADIAAVILEPLPANYGLLPQREEFLRHVFTAAKRVGALVIFDEVISGFRMGLGGMAERLGLRPDLVTYGKVIGGGFPVGCYGGRKDLMSLVAPEGDVYQAGTLSANPIGMRVGLRSLEKVFGTNGENFKILQNRAQKFFASLDSQIRELDIPVRLVHDGTLFWFHSKSEKPVRAPEHIPDGHAPWFKRFFHACLKQGIYLPPNAYEVGFLSLAHTETLLAEALRGFTAALKEANAQ